MNIDAFNLVPGAVIKGTYNADYVIVHGTHLNGDTETVYVDATLVTISDETWWRDTYQYDYNTQLEIVTLVSQHQDRDQAIDYIKAAIK